MRLKTTQHLLRGLSALSLSALVADHHCMRGGPGTKVRLAGSIVATGLVGAMIAVASMVSGPAGAAPAAGRVGGGSASPIEVPGSHSVAHCGDGGQCGGGPVENSPNQLDGVSCVSATNCVAVGSYYQITIGARQTLIEAWDGAVWRVVPSPSPSPASELLGVSCVSSTYCIAVGSSGPGQGNSVPSNLTLVEVWDGSTWTVVPSPNTGSPENMLRGVSCVTPTYCVAVGESGNPMGSTQTLTELWNGTAWSITPSPNPGSVSNGLFGVSCTNPTACMAVGLDGSDPGADSALAEFWNGTTWSVAPSPSPAPDSQLSGVSCPSAASCVAVGSQGNAQGTVFLTLAESWNGSSWTVIPSPSYGPYLNFLAAVSCTSPTNCVAVGNWLTGGTEPEFRTLVETWNGVSWAFVPSPSPDTMGGVRLTGVSCASATSCVAVGQYSNSRGVELTLVMSFNGTTWSIVASPNVRVLLTAAIGMAATPNGDGYWLADSAGDITTHGTAVNYGSMGGQTLNAPVAHIVATPDGKGYWMVAADGGTFSFGDARFFGSMGDKPLNAPVVGLAPTPSGHGYWLVAADGGVFSFGDATFAGSMGGTHLNQPVVGIATDSATGGYWLVAADGGVFSFGAPFLGSTGNITLNQPVVSITSTTDGGGYWIAASDGGVFAYGDAGFHGSMGGQHLNAPVVGMAADDATGGYWLVASDGGVFSLGAPFLGAG